MRRAGTTAISPMPLTADTVFVDTSAIYAILVATDHDHDRARAALAGLEKGRNGLVTSSYVMHETVALLQSRIGVGAIRVFQESVAPVLETSWVDRRLHERAMAALLASGRRDVSLTDWTSFVLMRDLRIETAFAFDEDFRTEGFRTIP
jgi:predicted nucleic acid-binding protein